MREARDRYLEVALRETFGVLTAPDLTDRVRETCRRGSVIGSRPAPARARLLRPALAAAAVLLAAVGVWFALRDGPTPEPAPPPPAPVPVARAAVPVRVLDRDFGERTGQDVFVDEIVVGPESGETRLALNGEAGITLRPGAVVGIGRSTLRLIAGELVVHGGPEGGPSVVTAGGHVVVRKGVVVGLRTVAGPYPEDPTTVEGIRALARVAAAATDPVLVLPIEGVVRVAGGLLVGPGEIVCMAADTGRVVGPDPGPTVLADILILVEELRIAEADIDVRGPPYFDQLKRAQAARDRAVRIVEKDGEGRELLTALLGRLPVDPERGDVRARVVEVLVRDTDLRERRRIRELLEREPDAFDRNALLALAEGGLEEVLPSLRAGLEGADPSRRLVPSAAFLALRGDATGMSTLRWAAALNLNFINAGERFLSAAALRRLGDAGPWAEAVAELTVLIEADLAAGRIDPARTLMARVWYFRPAAVEGRPVAVSWLSERLNRFGRENFARNMTADDIRERLRQLLE